MAQFNRNGCRAPAETRVFSAAFLLIQIRKEKKGKKRNKTQEERCKKKKKKKNGLTGWFQRRRKVKGRLSFCRCVDSIPSELFSADNNFSLGCGSLASVVVVVVVVVIVDVLFLMDFCLLLPGSQSPASRLRTRPSAPDAAPPAPSSAPLQFPFATGSYFPTSDFFSCLWQQATIKMSRSFETNH